MCLLAKQRVCWQAECLFASKVFVGKQRHDNVCNTTHTKRQYAYNDLFGKASIFVILCVFSAVLTLSLEH